MNEWWLDFVFDHFYLILMDFDQELDALGLLCPLPVLKARKRLTGLQAGQILRVMADDPASVVDFPHFCAEQGHELLDQSDKNGVFTFFILKK